MHLKPILSNEISRAILAGDYALASSLLPSKIEQVFDQPKVCEMVQAIGHAKVQVQIELELVKLSDLLSVGGNFTPASIPFIAEQLIQMYPSESIADFKICFQRGGIGQYGPIQRMDGVTVGVWMKKYLDEKYKVLENQLMNQKENIYEQQGSKDAHEWINTWLKQVENSPGPATKHGSSAMATKLQDIHPKGEPVYTPKDINWYIRRAEEKLVFYESRFRKDNPNASDDDVTKYMSKIHAKMEKEIEKIKNDII